MAVPRLYTLSQKTDRCISTACRAAFHPVTVVSSTASLVRMLDESGPPPTTLGPPLPPRCRTECSRMGYKTAVVMASIPASLWNGPIPPGYDRWSCDSVIGDSCQMPLPLQKESTCV